jgi:hypothetical protein
LAFSGVKPNAAETSVPRRQEKRAGPSRRRAAAVLRHWREVLCREQNFAFGDADWSRKEAGSAGFFETASMGMGQQPEKR